jgi:hypothetical protein
MIFNKALWAMLRFVAARIPYIEIRGVTDTANHQAAADFEANLVKAMSNLAKVIARWMETSTFLSKNEAFSITSDTNLKNKGCRWGCGGYAQPCQGGERGY